MKHATSETIEKIDSLINEIRKIPNLKEKKKGIFYKKSSAYLHFHEDEKNIVSDIKINGNWQRFQVNTNEEQKTFLNFIKNENIK